MQIPGKIKKANGEEVEMPSEVLNFLMEYEDLCRKHGLALDIDADTFCICEFSEGAMESVFHAEDYR